MSNKSDNVLAQYITPKGLREIDHWIAKYPADQKQSAVMSALRIVQEEQGHLTRETMDAVASYLGMPPIAVYEVATFYSMYALNPVGRHSVNVCTNISCQLRGSTQLVERLENHLGIKMGETTGDARFTLRSVECLGACVNAPMMQVDRNYHENLADVNLEQLLEQYP